MAEDYERFKLGAVEYPVIVSPLVGARERLDPPLNAALLFYVAMLQKHLGPYFDALCTSISKTDLVGKVVAEYVGIDPLPYMTSAAYKFPLLAVYRVEEDINERTVNWYQAQGKWTCLYILPPLDAAQASQLVHILKAVRAIIVDRTEQGYDPSYLSGAEVWKVAGISSIGVTSVKYGGVPQLDTNLRFPAIEISIAVDEREEKNPGLLTLEGLDAVVSTANGDPDDDLTVAEITWENVTP